MLELKIGAVRLMPDAKDAAVLLQGESSLFISKHRHPDHPWDAHLRIDAHPIHTTNIYTEGEGHKKSDLRSVCIGLMVRSGVHHRCTCSARTCVQL